MSVLLVEDDPAYAADIIREFSRDALAVTVARTLTEARAVLRQGQDPVDVVICALHLPDGCGESLLPDIEGCARQPITIVTSEFLPDNKADAFEYRPVALPRLVRPAALLRTVRTAVEGHTRPVIQRFVKRFNLTKREGEATTLLAQGLRIKEIADHMDCSEKNIYAHLARVSRKTGCRDYHQVVCLLLAHSCRDLGRTSPGRTPRG